MSNHPLFSTPPLQDAKTPTNTPAPASPGSSNQISLDEVRNALPTNLKSAATQNLVDLINNISTDPIMAENIRENFIGYTAVLREGRFKTEEYLNAVAYVSYKLMGYTNEDSYARTFPQRYATLLAKNTSKKDISAYVSAFHRGKLVNLIMEQSLVPTWVLNQDLFQKALNVQASLMMNANSEKVRTDAANSILNHLKKPENRDFQINMDMGETNGMKEMKDMLGQLAQQQQDMIRGGHMKTIDVAASRLIKKESEEEGV